MIQKVQIKRLLFVTLALGVIVALVVFWDQINSVLNGIDPDRVRAIVASAGPLGPLAIIGLMTLAIVASPVPSAPIAMAAGLVYGHLWGTVLVVIGAELGAIIAFTIARHFGRDWVQRWLGDSMKNRFFGSQNALMATVFLSRLLPFISFDAISYAAGLSHIKFWRFGLATLAGIVPASFVLTHLGASAFEGQSNAGFWISLALGAFGLLTVAIWRNPMKSNSDAAPVVPERTAK